MALSLAEAAKLSNDVVLAGVIETIVKESSVLARLPFVDIVGNALTYNRESVMAGADFFDPGDTWAESTGTRTQHTANLRILGGDADVDKFLSQTRSNVQDLEAVVLEDKSKAMAHEFDYEFIYGDVSVDAKGFDGLHQMCNDNSGQQVHQGSGTTGAALSLAKLDEMIDKIRPGKPDFLLCSRRTRRGLSKYARALTSPIVFDTDEFGKRVGFYDDIPILASDFMLDTETISSATYTLPTTGSTSSIFAVKLGERDVVGLQNGGVQLEDVGALETKDARRWRVKWYVSVALMSTLAIARLDGISSGDVTA